MGSVYVDIMDSMGEVVYISMILWFYDYLQYYSPFKYLTYSSPRQTTLLLASLKMIHLHLLPVFRQPMNTCSNLLRDTTVQIAPKKSACYISSSQERETNILLQGECRMATMLSIDETIQLINWWELVERGRK